MIIELSWCLINQLNKILKNKNKNEKTNKKN